ncbi:unnamed protein product, partial [Musa hybrid cultivar]
SLFIATAVTSPFPIPSGITIPTPPLPPRVDFTPRSDCYKRVVTLFRSSHALMDGDEAAVWNRSTWV